MIILVERSLEPKLEYYGTSKKIRKEKKDFKLQYKWLYSYILKKRANKPCFYSGNNIGDSWPCWILVQIKLKSCWKKLFALVVTSIV
jgi:hypothetical protein